MQGSRRQIVVFTEGKKTEPTYINHWARRNRERVSVMVYEAQGVPWTLVQRAVKRLRDDRRVMRRDDNIEYWCVFDMDIHPRVSDSIRMAKDNQLKVAFSNPCIELWFLLHFRDQEAHIERAQAQRDAGRMLGWEKKALPIKVLERLEDRFEDAKRRAQTLDRMHAGDGRLPGSNPSSGLWRLVDRIMEA